jgi:calpain-15
LRSYLYTDVDFPPNQKSLGNIESKCNNIEWKRIQHLEVICANGAVSKTKAHIDMLVQDGFSPDDIKQGQLGDCWLLSALASLSNYPETIDNAFISRQYNPRGKYSIKLWNECDKKFQIIHIDDFVPVDKNGPIFVKPNGNEMWVVLLEKAFAKLMGSYAAIEGGHSLYALQAITGDNVNKFSLVNGQWKKYDMRVTKVQNEVQLSFYVAKSKSSYDSKDMYELLADYHRCICMYCMLIELTDLATFC